MKITCNIIRDLLPLYAEDIANDDTKALIEEHIEGCASCMTKLEEMKQTQVIPNEVDNELIDKMKNKFTRVALNILLVMSIFFSILNLVSTSLNADIGFAEFVDMELDIFETFHYETEDGTFYHSTTIEELEEYGEVFNENNVKEQNLSASVSGKNNFSGSNLTKVKNEYSGKYIYYIEGYKQLSSSTNTQSWYSFNGDDMVIFDEDYVKPHYSEYIEAIYVATPTQDYLVYGDDVATEKFKVTYPFLGLHIFTVVIIILSIVCLIIRVKNNNSNNQQFLDIATLSMIIMLLSTIFSLGVILFDWHRFSVYNYYLMFNSIALASIISGIVAIFYVIGRSFKYNNIKYNSSIIVMTLGMLFTIFLEKIRIFEYIPNRINIDYLYVFYPILPIYLGLVFMLCYFVYKNDTNKPKVVMTKSYKITQGILIFNLVALQSYSLYIYSLKDKLLNQPTYVDGRLFLADYIFLADIINLSTGAIIIYAFYNLIKHKNYTMIGLILQSVAICMEKGCGFNLYLGSLRTMENLSFQVFILSYLMVGLTFVLNKKFMKGDVLDG